MGRHLDGSIEVGVDVGGHPLHIVGGVGLVYAGFFQQIDGLIVGDGSFDLGGVGAYFYVALHMDLYLIACLPFFLYRAYAVETVDESEGFHLSDIRDRRRKHQESGGVHAGYFSVFHRPAGRDS